MSMPSNPTSSYGRVRNAVRAFVDTATAAVKLVIKIAGRHRLMKLTLPKAYVRLGNDVYSTGRFRDDFAQLYERVRDNLQRIEELRRMSSTDSSQTQARTTRVKNALVRAVQAGRAWAVGKRNSSAWRELGRSSYDRYGDRAGPVDLTAPITNLKHRTEFLDQEIRELSEMHRHGILTPLRLIVITSMTLGCILLFSLWHGLFARSGESSSASAASVSAGTRTEHATDSPDELGKIATPDSAATATSTPDSERVASRLPRTPTRPSSPVANPSSQLESVTGTIDDLDAKAIVDLVIPVTSSTYLEAGFKEYHFGDNAETVNETAARNPVRSSEGRQRCVLDNGRLVVYSRTYLGDNKHYMDKLRELFGGALEENLTQAEGVGARGLGGQHESLIARYYFPKSIVHVIASWSAKADRFGGVTRSEEVTVVAFDRFWIESRLCKHVTRFREVVEWARNFVVEVNSEVLKMDGLPPFPGATPKHKQRSSISQFEDAQLLGANNKPFVAVSRALEDLRDQPAGTISLAINFMVIPGGVTDVLYEYSATEVNRCNALVTQAIFPPRSSSIDTAKSSDSHHKSYSWRTSDGWKITVAPACMLYLNNVPEKDL